MKQNVKSVSQSDSKNLCTYATNHLTEALIALLKEKDLEEISVCELTQKAGVSRSSFYRNYAGKKDILVRHVDSLFQEWMMSIEDSSETSLSEQIRLMIRHFEKHRDFYSILYERNLTYLLKDGILGLCGFHPEADPVQAYASAFAGYVLYGWIDIWFQREMKETSDDLATLFKKQGL